MYRDAKGFISGEVHRRSTAAGQQVNSSAEHLRTIASQLRGDDFGRVAAPYVDRGAATLEQVARYLQDTDGDQLLADAESFGRERPWAVAGAGFLVGMAASRMIKASAAGRASSASGRSSGDWSDAKSASGTRAPYATPGDTGTPVSSDAAPLTARAGSGATRR